MKILFTKNIGSELLSKELGNDISAECIEVIRIENLKVEVFDLKNYSLIFTSSNGVKSFLRINLNQTKILPQKTTIKSTASARKQKEKSERMVSGLLKF
nr:hypothetical protein [Chryseobacterium sp. 3008163]